jgi:DNA polymerase elongation subunit (family B)
MKKFEEKEDKFEGAYVKEPHVGMHKWVISFDLDSLYPHLIMQYGISPECMVNKNAVKNRIQQIRQKLKQRGVLE